MTVTELISKVFLPISLAIIMLGMGMGLMPSDFTRIVKYPKAILIGLTNQFILLPIIGFSLAVSFDLNPTTAVGLIILASCPGGVVSNLITQVCKGNIALSVTLTAIASVLSIITIPFILSFALEYFGKGTDLIINLPILDTIVQIMIIVVIPISTGMLILRLKPHFAKRMKKPMHFASIFIFVLVFIAVIISNLSLIGNALVEVGFVTLILNIITMGVSYLVSKLLKLNIENTISITIESGIQNGALAFVIATSILNNIEMAIPTVAYTIWMFLTGGLLMWQIGKCPNTPLKQVNEANPNHVD